MLNSHKLFPLHAGVWEGKYTYYSSEGKIYQEFKSKLTLLMHGKEWRQINEYSHKDGTVEVLDFGLSLFDNKGILHFNTPRLIGKSWEGEDNIFVSWTLREFPGSHYLEVITLLDPKHRIRTWQHTQNGIFLGITFIEEYKVSCQKDMTSSQIEKILSSVGTKVK
jgi:hypothetical protein